MAAEKKGFPAGSAPLRLTVMTDMLPQSLIGAAARGPVVVSVPHAGRAYPPELQARLRVPLDAVRPLEDRFADLLTEGAAQTDTVTIVADAPRLLIDLNRAPDDLDPSCLHDGHSSGSVVSAKARAGLGLVPTRLWGVGPLWRAPLMAHDIEERLQTVHRPYHDSIARALGAARRRWGTALLVDLHSMPPIAGPDAPDIVIGDRFGHSAHSRITAAAEMALAGLALRVAINAPYAGGYIVRRHGDPKHNVSALQIEVDRRLYLDAALDQPGPGLVRMQQVIVRLLTALHEELLGCDAAAAE
jgi:N-formylglutamate amidohydrolase